MKKYLLLLLLCVSGMAQTYQNPAFGTVKTMTAPTSVTPPTMATIEASGTLGKIVPEDIPMNVIPPTTHYSPITPTLKGHFQGIDDAIGNIAATTAGITTRVWFTGDPTTITAGTFYLTNQNGKGSVANVSQSVTNDDNQKKYFAQDLIGLPFGATTLFPPGVYAGNLSASTTPNSAQQRFTVELYRCDTNGTPIASGIAGAPVGDLGVTVILILDSGLLTLADGSVTNVPVSASLASQFTISAGERIRYHVSAEKVGTASSSITESVWYGNSFNSFLDVPTPITSSGVANLSTVTGASVTNALDNLNVGKANDANVLHTTGNETKTGDLTVNNLVLPLQTLSSTAYRLKGTNATNDNWSIYGSDGGSDKGELVFEVGDSGDPFNNSPIPGERFRFHYDATGGGTAKDPFIIDYNEVTANANVTATSFIKSGAASANILLAGGADISQSSFIQNQNISAQTANIWISGTIKASSLTTALYNYSNNGITIRNMADSADLWSINRGAGDGSENWNFYNFGRSSIDFSLKNSDGSLTLSSLAGTGTRTVVADVSGNLSATAVVPLRYVAMMSQSGTSAPTVTVLQNTLGTTLTWSRVSTGIYRCAENSALIFNATAVQFTNGTTGDMSINTAGTAGAGNSIFINTTDNAGNLIDGAIGRATITIEVYPY